MPTHSRMHNLLLPKWLLLLLVCFTLVNAGCEKSGADPNITCCTGGYTYAPGDSALENGQTLPIRLITFPVFTPNGDLRNPLFKADSLWGIKQLNIEVRGAKNRLIWSTNSIEGAWDGRLNNFPSTEGGYKVRLRFTDAKDRRVDTTTSVCLIRTGCVGYDCIDLMTALQGFTDPALNPCQQ